MNDLNQQIVATIPRLRRFALGLTGDPTKADDVVQAALERALARLHQFKQGTRLDSWLFRIVQTTWIDTIRRSGRQEETLEPDDLDKAAAPYAENGGTTALIRKDVAAGMNALTEDQRIVVMLVLVEGYSYQEAAKTLDVPMGTVMSRISRAREILAKQLADWKE